MGELPLRAHRDTSAMKADEREKQKGEGCVLMEKVRGDAVCRSEKDTGEGREGRGLDAKFEE